MDEIKADYVKAIDLAALTLVNHGFIKDPPVIAAKIARDMGFKIVFGTFSEKYKDVAGFVDKEKKEICVNSEDYPQRQNFTIAHELGHIILNHDFGDKYQPLYRKPIGSNETDPQEKEANCFAANLLVPINMLIKFMKDPDDLVAIVFGVSQDVIKYRKEYIKRALQ